MIKKMLAITLICLGCTSGPQHPTERAENRFLQKYSTAAMETFHLRYLGRNVATNGEITEFGARFMTDKLHTLDMARPLMVQSAQKFISAVNADKSFSKRFKDHSLELKDLDYYVSFWDEATQRPPQPYVALATVKNGKITYHFKCDDSEFLDDSATVTESFEEAQSRLK